MRKLSLISLRAIAILSGCLFFISLPTLFFVDLENREITVSFVDFLNGYLNALKNVFNINNLNIFSEWFKGRVVVRYQYSMTVLGCSLVLVIIGATVLSTIVLSLPLRVRDKMKSLINFSESLPDLLVIFLFQYGVIYLYSKHGFKMLQLYGGQETNPYFIPIVIVALLPGFYLSQFLIRELETEEKRDYILLARSKGLSKFRILFRHMIRNVLPLYIVQLRTVIWVLLCNLVVIEYLFTLRGFAYEVLFTLTGIQFLFGLLLLAFPLVLSDAVIRVIQRYMVRKETI